MIWRDGKFLRQEASAQVSTTAGSCGVTREALQIEVSCHRLLLEFAKEKTLASCVGNSYIQLLCLNRIGSEKFTGIAWTPGPSCCSTCNRDDRRCLRNDACNNVPGARFSVKHQVLSRRFSSKSRHIERPAVRFPTARTLDAFAYDALAPPRQRLLDCRFAVNCSRENRLPRRAVETNQMKSVLPRSMPIVSAHTLPPRGAVYNN
jgi:hypothetical protein